MSATTPTPARHSVPWSPSDGPERPRVSHRAEDDAAEVSPRLLRGVGSVLMIGGAVGAVVALVLLIEKLRSLQNTGYVPSCSIDPVLSCGTIMKTAQASVLGFPNPVIGLVTFPVLILAGALVFTGMEMPRWFWLGLQFGSAAGLAFIVWLIVQSLVVIHALCPYCMVAWAAVTAIFWYVTVHNLAAGHLDLGRAGEALARRHGWVLAGMYVVIVAAVLATFPAYFAGRVGL